jgi:hypothetical protein
MAPMKIISLLTRKIHLIQDPPKEGSKEVSLKNSGTSPQKDSSTHHLITKEGSSILDPPLDEPKVETKEPRDVEMDPEKTRDTPSKEDPPSQQGSIQHGLVEEFVFSDLEKYALKVSWVDQVKEDEIQEQLDPLDQDNWEWQELQGPHQRKRKHGNNSKEEKIPSSRNNQL